MNYDYKLNIPYISHNLLKLSDRYKIVKVYYDYSVHKLDKKVRFMTIFS